MQAEPYMVMLQRAPEEMRMRVWIDQDSCTGDGLCDELAPEVFVIYDRAFVGKGVGRDAPTG
jgi:hypothetical protein